ncbi:ABC transporter ATP-binding protein [Bizionia arctica]|uniref:ABC transporter ATP-binding protein n=1 Tax=Bizionia arctica TaxID=1495645 RepID=A0A917GKM0_9FLAO|nr:ATP-binding cassette domain-containing protein [Bizionia arctica]GGG49353.1 ABC transporter ATP-binding protein [Bizionia arctica]
MDNSRETVVEIKNLYKSFGDHHVLNGVNLNLYKSENLVVMGKSGTGKSVLIKCLVGLITPDKGDVSILGKKLNHLTTKDWDALRSEVGFLFQGGALYDSMSVRENLEFPLRHHREKFGVIKDTTPRVMAALESVGLANTIDLMPKELSGGMQKRVALARTLILEPKIILYDEPTTGLDPITSREIVELIGKVQHTYGTSSIIITHDIDCAKVISDRVVLLLDGINYTEGSFNDLYNAKDPRIAAFFKK